MSPTSADKKSENLEDSSFICGVVEGFYGRPWTTEQRKDLFTKLQVRPKNSVHWNFESGIQFFKREHRIALLQIYIFLLSPFVNFVQFFQFFSIC